MAFMTTITYANYQTIPEADLALITAEITQYQADGKYTGEGEYYYSPAEPTTYIVKRWDWIDEASAQLYLDMVASYYPAERITDISTVITSV